MIQCLGFILFLVRVQGTAVQLEACTEVSCRPGRECVLMGVRDTQCVCLTKCPDNWKPVCGSDGTSYDNHCELHRAACIDGKHISPLHPGFCKKDRETLIAREEFIEEISGWEREKKTPIPMACFENDRNRLREFLMSWLNLSADKQKWYSHGMSYNEILSGHYTSMDVNQDGYLDSEEMYRYISRNNSINHPQGKADKIRELCLDALVEEGDVNMDWRLGYTEYREILQEDYQPSIQVCKMNGRVYSDGAETKVECNGCVCACGKWVCTSNKCSEGFNNIYYNKLRMPGDIDYEEEEGEEGDEGEEVEEGEEDYGEEEEYKKEGVEDQHEEEYDEQNPEDDPDVKDINWF